MFPLSFTQHEAWLLFSTINEAQNPDLCSIFVLKCWTEVPNHTSKTPLQCQLLCYASFYRSSNVVCRGVSLYIVCGQAFSSHLKNRKLGPCKLRPDLNFVEFESFHIIFCIYVCAVNIDLNKQLQMNNWARHLTFKSKITLWLLECCLGIYIRG